MTQAGQKINRYQQYDSNNDRGYGRLTPKFHAPRSFLQYPEPVHRDPEAEADIDDATYAAVLSKILDVSPTDPYAKNSVDPFYFAGSATKMTEISTAKGMVPFPNMYNSKQAIAGGTSPKYPTGPTKGFQSRARPTGTKKGFSSAPYPHIDSIDDEIDDYEGIMTTNLDQRHVNLIKKLVNLIHLEQER